MGLKWTVPFVKDILNLFNSYMWGELEYLHENLIVETVSPEDEDHSDARITNMIALLKRDLDEGEKDTLTKINEIYQLIL